MLFDLVTRASIAMESLSQHRSACDQMLSPMLQTLVRVAKQNNISSNVTDDSITSTINTTGTTNY